MNPPDNMPRRNLLLAVVSALAAVYVGTLHGLRPRPNVLIRVYKVV